MISAVIWLVCTRIVAWIGIAFFSFIPTFPYSETLPSFAPALFSRFAGFDGVHYLKIAADGYFGTGLIQAFFPLYPMLIRVLSLFGILSLFWVGTILSLVCLYGILRFFKRFALQSNVQYRWLLVSLFLFPTSFFFTGIYTESLFLLFVLAAFLLLHKQKWFFAGLVIACATATRITGVFLIPAGLLVVYQARKSMKNSWIAYGSVLLGTAGIGLYMLYLWRVFDDPLFFFHVQSEFGGGRQESFILLPQVFVRYIKMLFTIPYNTRPFYSAAFELFLTVEAGSILFLQTFTKQWKVAKSWLLYAWGGFILPTVTGTLSSMPRYVLVLFPLFIFYAHLHERKPILYFVLMGIHAILLTVNIILFVRGIWVA